MPIFGKSRVLHDATSDAIGRIGYAYYRTAYADCTLGKAELVVLFQVFEKNALPFINKGDINVMLGSEKGN